MNVTRSGAAVLGVASLVLCVAGCSSGSTSSGSATKTASPSASSSAVARGQHLVDPCKKLKPATGPPARTFGGRKVSAGYCEMLRFTLEGSFVSNLMKEGAFRPEQFVPFRAYMTPVARAGWDRDVAKISASGPGARSAFNDVLAITYLDVTGRSYTLGNAQTPRPVSNRKFFSGRAAVVSIHGAPRLKLAIKISFQLNLTDNKTSDPIAVKGTKSVTYVLAENPVASQNKPWLIDGWRGTTHFGTIKRVSTGQ